MKRCLYTQKLYLFIVTSFFYLFIIISCSFSVFVENCILLPKDINELVVFLSIVHLWFRFFTLLPRFVLLVIKGQFFPRIQILFQSAFFFSFKNVGSKPFYMSKIHPKCKLHGIIVISYHNHFVPAILYHCENHFRTITISYHCHFVPYADRYIISISHHMQIDTL